MPRRPMTALMLLALSQGASGCYDGFDPLHPDVLAEIARTRGTASGVDLSGLYVGAFEALECGCAPDQGAQDFSLCSLVELAENVGQEDIFPLFLVQADGTVQVQARPLDDPSSSLGTDFSPTLYGPLDDDGRIAAAGVLQADALVANGRIFARLDGMLVESSGPPVLEAEYQQRYQVGVVEGSTLEGQDEVLLRNVDCRERIGMSLTWLADLPVPSSEDDEG